MRNSGGYAGRIQDQLVQALGSDILFMDVDAIPLGANFVRVLHDEVAKCEVLLAVIGRNWLDARDEHGNHRLENQTISFELRLERRFNAISLWSQSWWMAPGFRMHANCPRNSKNFLSGMALKCVLHRFTKT